MIQVKCMETTKEDEAYSEEDEVIMNSLLMWGELESTIM